MRQKTIAQRSISDHSIDLLMKIIKRDETLHKIDRIIENNKHILDSIHEQLTSGLSSTGAKGMSGEQIFRVAIIKQLKRHSWRELAIQLNGNIDLRWFSRFHSATIPHYTTLQKAVGRIKAKTWEKISEKLVQLAKEEKVENGRYLRADTTVTDTNIHYPTDARLLWDGIRVLTRSMERIKEHRPHIDFGFADRTRRSKKKCYQITMTKGPKADKKRRKLYRELIKVANEVFEMTERCLFDTPDADDLIVEALMRQLEHNWQMMAVAIIQCERRILNGEKVPAAEKLVSFFENHTDIICRGKSDSPTEFGHKINFGTGKSGLITQYEVLRGNPGDNELLPGMLKKHKAQYGKAPFGLSADRRYFSADNETQAYEAGVKRVSICKPGYRSKVRRKIEKAPWFKKLQKFRAGIEGIISGLMRGLGLKRCPWKGFEGFKRYVGLSVVTFNLRKIADLT